MSIDRSWVVGQGDKMNDKQQSRAGGHQAVSDDPMNLRGAS